MKHRIGNDSPAALPTTINTPGQLFSAREERFVSVSDRCVQPTESPEWREPGLLKDLWLVSGKLDPGSPFDPAAWHLRESSPHRSSLVAQEVQRGWLSSD